MTDAEKLAIIRDLITDCLFKIVHGNEDYPTERDGLPNRDEAIKDARALIHLLEQIEEVLDGKPFDFDQQSTATN